MHAGSSQTSKVEEVLAITLLNNANLGETTLSSAKIQLINAANFRDSQSANKNCLLEDQDFNDLDYLAENLNQALQVFQS